MSPDQASGERDYDGRSDLYSLACVLYEAIAGMPPFVGPNAHAVLVQRLLHVPRPVRVYCAGATVELESVLVRALAIAPADRYQSAAELTDALCRAIEAPGAGSHGAASITAGGAPFLARRHAWLAGAGVIAVGVIAALFGPLHLRISFASRVPPDTTRIAIFPIQLVGAGAVR